MDVINIGVLSSQHQGLGLSAAIQHFIKTALETAVVYPKWVSPITPLFGLFIHPSLPSHSNKPPLSPLLSSYSHPHPPSLPHPLSPSRSSIIPLYHHTLLPPLPSLLSSYLQVRIPFYEGEVRLDSETTPRGILSVEVLSCTNLKVRY